MCKFKPLHRNSRPCTESHHPDSWTLNPENDLVLGNECLCNPVTGGLQHPRSGQAWGTQPFRAQTSAADGEARKSSRLITSCCLCLNWGPERALWGCKYHNGPIWNFPPLFAPCLGSRRERWGAGNIFSFIHKIIEVPPGPAAVENYLSYC